MRHENYCEISPKKLFTLYDSVKSTRTKAYNIHHHAELEIGYVLAGEAEYIIGENSYAACAGDTFLIGVNLLHSIPEVYTSEFVLLNFRITSYYLWNYCSDYIPQGILKHLISGENIKQCFSGKDEYFSKIQSLSVHAEQNRYAIRKTLFELICSIADDLIEAEDNYIEDESTSILHLEEILSTVHYIQDNLSAPITLDDIVKQSKLSKSYLITLFHSVTGITPYEYLILQRIERAITLLKETPMSILEISYECGFRSQTNFNKSFKKVTSISPREYRAMMLLK